MENASKALIMAGAVLIAILLISTGILIFKSTTRLEEQVGTTSKTMAASSFNSQFTSFIGNNVPSVQVKSLISRIISSNAQNGNKQITVKLGTDKIDPKTISITDNFYNVTIEEYTNDGYISIIKIQSTSTSI